MIFTLSKLATLLLLPPGIFIAALFAAAFFAKRFKKSLFVAALLFLLLSTSFSNYLLKPLEEKRFDKNPVNPMAVVVLGGGQADKDPYLKLSPQGVKRIVTALLLANKKSLPLIYSGYEGGNANARFTIEIMIKNFNLPFKECKEPKRGCFVIEGKSRDTYENAKYTKALLKQKAPSVILVTSAYHMPRSYRIFRHFGFYITPKKTDFRSWERGLSFWSHLPNMYNLYNSYLALHEYLGLLSLYLRGL